MGTNLCDLEGLLSLHVSLLRRLATLVMHQLLRLVKPHKKIRTGG